MCISIPRTEGGSETLGTSRTKRGADPRPGHVTAARYVRGMDESLTPTVAGEELDVLESALDRMQLEMEPCGCISMRGQLPADLSEAVGRALRTIEFEMFGRGVEPWSSPEADPFGELLFRIVTARSE